MTDTTYGYYSYARAKPLRLAAVDRSGAGIGPGSGVPGPGRGDVDVPSAAPPVDPGPGLTSVQVAEYQAGLAGYARWRLLTEGATQYDLGAFQKSEQKSLALLVEEAREEIADLINYITFIDIRLQRMLAAVQTHGGVQ